MALFQQSVLNKHIKTLDPIKVAKAFETFKGYFQKAERVAEIRGMKEEEYQDGFLDDLFINVLGYTKKPNEGYNLERETKNTTNSKKADASLINDGNITAVIELKSTKTVDFSKIESQAFGYKRNHAKCTYVITSNFEKLKFYIQDAINPLEFNLFKLSESDFKLLYLCLSKEHLFADTALKIKTESTIKEEDVTKKLYKDYSAFKKALFNDLVELNPEYDKLVLFKKSQKLIDRFLFIFFAEDKGLLPPNSISEIVNNYQKLKDLDFEKPLIEVFKQYFGYINIGREKKGTKAEIFAYNGGLFAPDEILDQVQISNAVLKEHTLKLTAYDFETEVDVNILGHIFEHSLNEIDEMTAEIEGHTIDKKKTKRKKDGVFYTPKFITKYIVDNTVGKLCEEKKAELGFKEDEYFEGRKATTKKKHLKTLEGYRNYLLSLTICDPACGSGAFLNQALDFLIKEHYYLDELKTKLLGGSMVLSDVTNDILEKNLYGVDINEESVDIARLSLWLRSAKAGRALTTLSSNIKCGNSLIDDKEVASNKAFNWEKEFPEVFESGGFDIVIGNPPYGANFNDSEKEFFKKQYSEVHKRTPESFNYFIYKIENIIHSNSKWGVIIPTSFLYQYEFEKTRKFLLENSKINKVVNLGDDVFQDVATPTCILIITKNQTKSSYGDFQEIERNQLSVKLFESTNFLDATELHQNDSYSFIVKPNKELILKCFKQPKLREIAEDVATGISPGLGKAFVKTEAQVQESKLENDLLKNLIIGGEINRYFLNPLSTKKIIYATNTTDIESYPNIFSELKLFKDKLDKRVETASGRIKWYVMLRPRRLKLFEKEKILVRQTANKIMASHDIHKWYCLKSGLIIQLPENSSLSYSYLLAILNSKLMNFLYQDLVGEGGRLFPEVKPVQLFKLPIKTIDIKNKIEIDIKNKIEDCVEEIQNELKIKIDTQREFLDFIKAKYKILKPSKKLNSWSSLDDIKFLSEMNKVKVKLNIKEEMELLKLFKGEQTKIQNLNQSINKIDKEIDYMIYELYGLIDEEIAIVDAI